MCARCQALKNETPFGAGWHDMTLAPRDGGTIEIESHAGAKPHRGLYRWSSERGWVDARDDRLSIAYGDYAWRAFSGDPKTYSDPYSGFDDFNFVVLGMRPMSKLAAAETRWRKENREAGESR